MSVEQLWADIAGAGPGSADEVAAALVDLLVREPEKISDTDHALAALLAASYRTELWGAAHLIKGGCSEDAFDCLRAHMAVGVVRDAVVTTPAVHACRQLDRAMWKLRDRLEDRGSPAFRAALRDVRRAAARAGEALP